MLQHKFAELIAQMGDLQSCYSVEERVFLNRVDENDDLIDGGGGEDK